MLDFFKANFYWIDFALATLICIIVIVLYVTKHIERFTWFLYWVGFCLGMCWEFSMGFSTEMGIFAFYVYLKPLPTHFMVIVITHSLWDGGLFLVGYVLVKKICAEPTFKKFKASELCVLIIWGQLQELAVELLSTYSNAWEYIPYWWNPMLFLFNGQNITLLPQVIWFIAIIVFYFIVLKIEPRFSSDLPIPDEESNI